MQLELSRLVRAARRFSLLTPPSHSVLLFDVELSLFESIFALLAYKVPAFIFFFLKKKESLIVKIHSVL